GGIGQKQGERAPGHANGLAGCGAGRMQQVRICGARPALFLDQLHQPALDRGTARSEEHTSELQSRRELVCGLLLEKKTVSCVVVFGFYLSDEKANMPPNPSNERSRCSGSRTAFHTRYTAEGRHAASSAESSD